MMVNSTFVRKHIAYVIKTPRGFLDSVWEHLGDEEENFDFVEKVHYAYKFYVPENNQLLPLKAPKYLYNIETGASIDTLEEAAAYLNGELIKVTITETVKYEGAK